MPQHSTPTNTGKSLAALAMVMTSAGLLFAVLLHFADWSAFTCNFVLGGLIALLALENWSILGDLKVSVMACQTIEMNFKVLAESHAQHLHCLQISALTLEIVELKHELMIATAKIAPKFSEKYASVEYWKNLWDMNYANQNSRLKKSFSHPLFTVKT